MTAQEVRLCGLLLQEGGAQNLRTIANETNTPLDLVKKSLCVLVQHGACEFGSCRRGPGSPVEYRASCERVLKVLRYPRYIYTAKTLYGDTGELIGEEVLQRGHMTMSNTVKTVADRLTHNMEEGRSMEYSEVVSAFSKLVETHFLQRCTPVAEMGTAATSATPVTPGTAAAPASTAPPTAESNPDCYKLPHVTLIGRGKRRCSSDDSEEQRGGKKAKMDSESCGDEGIYWQVNFERFHQHFRDQAIISAVASKMDQTSIEIVRTMLRMSEVTTTQTAAYTQPLSANEIFRSLPPNYSISRPILDQYLSLLVDDPMEFVGKSGDSGGGMYVVNLQRALANLARATLESVVQERFGSRSARIFRLLLRKRHLEQKQVEDFSMIPAKEAKDMLYTLLSENLVQLQVTHKYTHTHYTNHTLSCSLVFFHPRKSLRLLTTYLLPVHCVCWRSPSESRRSWRRCRPEQPEQLTEVEEMITAPERQQLEALRHHINKYCITTTP
uniref:DNA-directed RNA polymerase III subunit RPC3 n=1 Tax=Hucho hucho TaxID=62062 RepID=A0A4W5R5M5_9TELE